jgi:hypothetical protein
VTAWRVKSDEERDRWDFVPLVGVGPLRFGMGSDEALSVLDPDRCTHPDVRPLLGGAGEMSFAGVTMYFGHGLSCVAVDACTGPQVVFDDVPLVGRVPSEMEQWVLDHAQRHRLELRYTHAADPELAGLGLIMRAQRAGDIVLSRPVFLAERAEVTWDDVPSREWSVF